MQRKLLAPYSEFYTSKRVKHPINIKSIMYDAILSSMNRKILSQGQNL